MTDWPLSVTLPTLARAAGVTERTARSWVEAGHVRTWQFPKPRGRRYVTLDELHRLEAEGVPLDWDVLIGRA